jgi:glycosyltransferase involved in cell wall biosynthesis
MQYLRRKGCLVIAVANDEADFGSKLNRMGFPFINISIDHKGKNPFHDILLTKKLIEIYKKERPDLVHHFTIKPVIYGSIAAKVVKKTSVVNTITGLGYVFNKGGTLKYLTLLLYKVSLLGQPRVIFQNKNDYWYFLSKGFVSKKTSHVILGSGINTAKLKPLPYDENINEINFLIVSRMLWSKGIGEFIKAAKKVLELYPNTKFTMIGGVSGGGAVGNPDAIPDDWINSETNCENINWIGRLSFEKVIKYLEQCSVFVLPSYREGLSRSLIEAAAKGKAIITTDAPGCREVLKNGVNGFLVPIKDVDALAECMLKFIREPNLIREMGNESRKRAVELFDEQIVLDQTVLVYRAAGAQFS